MPSPRILPTDTRSLAILGLCLGLLALCLAAIGALA
jgi:hypothetical protein